MTDATGHRGNTNTERELNNATPNYSWWLNKELWELHKACSLLVGLEPVSSKGLHHPDQITQTIEDASLRERWREIYSHAKDAMQLQKIDSHPGRTGRWVGLRLVKPKQLVKWAKKRGYQLPEQIETHFSSAGTKTTSKKEHGPVVTKAQLASLFQVTDWDTVRREENKKWWDDMSRNAKRNRLDGCKQEKGNPGKSPTFYLAKVARWLIEEDHMSQTQVINILECEHPELLEKSSFATWLRGNR